MNLAPRRLGWIIVILGVIVLVVMAFRPTPIRVDLHAVAPGTLRSTVDAEGPPDAHLPRRRRRSHARNHHRPH